jgi:nucleotide-binding universal stress UspA family protein
MGQDILASYERKLKEEDLRNAKVLLQKGDPAQRIIETANIEKCGLIVIGRLGRRLQRIIAWGAWATK